MWRPRRVFEAARVLFHHRAPNIGCHFQGTLYYPPDPGLKPCIAASRQSPTVPYGTVTYSEPASDEFDTWPVDGSKRPIRILAQ
jgi:hypothetical protein